MNTIQALADIESGALTHVARADNMRYSVERGLSIRQSFYIYPNDRVIAVDCCDGSYSVTELTGEDLHTFMGHYPEFFRH